jgi:hypothetical protein
MIPVVKVEPSIATRVLPLRDFVVRFLFHSHDKWEKVRSLGNGIAEASVKVACRWW